MRATSAVCIRCGSAKPRALEICASCSFAPASAEDRARSLLLSPAFDAGEEVVGLTHEELSAAAAQIRSGQPYAFDPAIVETVKGLHEAAQAITPRRLAVDLARWLVPPAALLAGAYWLLWHR
jgi:hypothetical protein